MLVRRMQYFHGWNGALELKSTSMIEVSFLPMLEACPTLKNTQLTVRPTGELFSNIKGPVKVKGKPVGLFTIHHVKNYEFL